MAVIGFTEGEENKLREFLFAVQKDDNNFIQIGRVGNGLTEEQKIDLYQHLSKDIIKSSYIEVDKRRVAFQMVKPNIVIEVSLNELLTENTKGLIKNHLLKYSEYGGYSFISSTNGISLLHPIFKRVRADKNVNNEDVRFSQITDIVHIDNTDNTQIIDLPKSEMLFREVYTKTAKGKTNVQKFLAWKTNKEEQDISYPAYVMNYTNFSPTRGDPLKKDIRVSSSKEQILELIQGFVNKNIKKGWENL